MNMHFKFHNIVSFIRTLHRSERGVNFGGGSRNMIGREIFPIESFPKSYKISFFLTFIRNYNGCIRNNYYLYIYTKKLQERIVK